MSPKAGKLLKGTLIASLTGGLLYATNNIGDFYQGDYVPIIVAVIGSVINALKVAAQKV